MHCLSVVDDILCLSPLEEMAHIVEKVSRLSLRNIQAVCILRCLCTAFGCEKVHLIAWPSAREVDAESAMVTRIPEIVRNEHELITGEDLRISAHCRHHRHRDLHAVRILAEDITKTSSVMVAREDHHIRKIVIYEVMRKDVVDAGHTLAPARIVLVDAGTHRVMEREVHDGLEV